MNHEVVKTEQLDEVINKSGLAIQQGEDVKRSYMPFLDEIANIQNESQKINFDNPSETDEKIARDLRLRMVKQRTGAKELKDSRKAIYLRLGDVEQKSYNLIESTAKLAEEVLLQVEKRREIAEKKRKEELRISRLSILSEFCDNFEIYPVQDMDESAFNDLAEGLKQAKIKKEQEAERLRLEEIEKEKKQNQFNSRRLILSKMVAYTGEEILGDLSLETTDEEFLVIMDFCNKKKEEWESEQERIKAEKIESDKKLEEERENIRKEKEKMLAEQKKKDDERKRKEDEIEAERKKIEDEKKKIEAQKKAEEDAKRESERIEKEKEYAKSKQSDKQKMENFVNSFVAPEYPSLNDSENMKALVDIMDKFNGFKNWALKRIS